VREGGREGGRGGERGREGRGEREGMKKCVYLLGYICVQVPFFYLFLLLLLHLLPSCSCSDSRYSCCCPHRLFSRLPLPLPPPEGINPLPDLVTRGNSFPSQVPNGGCVRGAEGGREGGREGG